MASSHAPKAETAKARDGISATPLRWRTGRRSSRSGIFPAACGGTVSAPCGSFAACRVHLQPCSRILQKAWLDQAPAREAVGQCGGKHTDPVSAATPEIDARRFFKIASRAGNL